MFDRMDADRRRRASDDGLALGAIGLQELFVHVTEHGIDAEVAPR